MRFVPDRPGATTGHATIGGGCLQLETSVAATRAPSSTGLTFPTLLRFGVAEPLELRLGHGLIDLQFPDGADLEAGASALAFEVKLMALEAAGMRPGFGALIGASAPTNSDFSDELTPYVAWLADWPFANSWSASLNMGLRAPPPPEPVIPSSAGSERAAYFAVGALLGFSPPVPGGWLSLYADGSGGIALRDGDWEQALGGGAAFTVADGVQLDGSAAAVVTGSEHPVTFGSGLAWQF